nr:hypothetical protein [Candidatus Woesearchaeota archaeon]
MLADLTCFDMKGKSNGFPRFINVNIEHIKEKSQLRRLNRKNLVIAEGKINREILESKNIDVLLSPEKHSMQDFFHNRNSGLNHVLCKIAKKNNIAIGININEILNLNIIERSLRIGRIMQNIRLCRKYKILIVAGSFAKNEEELMNYNDLVSFLESIGMTPKEARDCFSNISEIIENKKGFIGDGIKIID